ncbi:MAG: radical SAM family heme chaperone HemW [Bacteroidetes bacterium]|nr:radical SAM family heme chaperone HemW [Bacteroidota bacterium]
MPGLYIHIPFCRQACNYCNFHFSVSQKNRPDFLSALVKEINITKDFYTSSKNNSKIFLDTLYFGGGTPSILSINELEQIFVAISSIYDFNDKSEITLEANPDDLTITKIAELKSLGINRLSIGIQSFFEEDLMYMNRLHSVSQAEDSIKNVFKAGIENITIDLIYGIPTLTNERWTRNLKKAFEFGVPHISSYALTVEEKTPLDFFIKKEKLQPVSDELAAIQFEIMLELMEKNNFQHYEISNFGKSGFFSRHNLSYWTGLPYLGLGPAAHSYIKGKRFWNISNTSKYISSINDNKLPRECEELSLIQQVNEYIMTSIRTMWGCDLFKIKNEFGDIVFQKIEKTSEKYIRNGLLMKENNNLILTKKGKFLADGIAADLFVD